MTARQPGVVNGPLCPECESTSTRTRATGYSHGDDRIRVRRCDDCRHRFLTVETPIEGTTWGSLIPYSRENDRARQRTKFGHREHHELRKDIAYLDIRVDVRKVPPRRAA